MSKIQLLHYAKRFKVASVFNCQLQITKANWMQRRKCQESKVKLLNIMCLDQWCSLKVGNEYRSNTRALFFLFLYIYFPADHCQAPHEIVLRLKHSSSFPVLMKNIQVHSSCSFCLLCLNCRKQKSQVRSILTFQKQI